MEREFSVRLPNKPGELARLTEKLRDAEVNIKTISTEPKAEVVRLIADNPDKARETLNSANMQFSERNVLVTKLEDKPGELARISSLLAKENVNIDAAYMLGKEGRHVHVALVVSDEEKAKNILKL